MSKFKNQIKLLVSDTLDEMNSRFSMGPKEVDRWAKELERKFDNKLTIIILEHEDELFAELLESKNQAYSERNQLVLFLSKLYPSHLALHDPNDTSWESDWRTIVCIHSPAGQLTWHIHDSEFKNFAHLMREADNLDTLVAANHWDGHTTEEKYKRLKRLPLEHYKELGHPTKQHKKVLDEGGWA